MKKCIILANGSSPKKREINYFDKVGYTTLICADGGANHALRLDIIPDYIIGDLDSIKAETYDYYFDKCEILRINRQNDTDVEKCLKYAVRKKFKDAIILGGTGNRLDHSFCNLGIVLKFSEKINVKILHQRNILFSFTGIVKLKTQPGEIISLYGISEKTKITSKGLKYPLKNISLPFGKRESTGNVALKSEVILNIRGSNIFVIRDFDIMRKYGLF